MIEFDPSHHAFTFTVSFASRSRDEKQLGIEKENIMQLSKAQKYIYCIFNCEKDFLIRVVGEAEHEHELSWDTVRT